LAGSYDVGLSLECTLQTYLRSYYHNDIYFNFQSSKFSSECTADSVQKLVWVVLTLVTVRFWMERHDNHMLDCSACTIGMEPLQGHQSQIVEQ